MYGRAHAQAAVVRDLADRYRLATMATLRIAFLSALVLEILASLAVALVAVPLGFRLLDGQIALHTALLVLLLVPEAFIAIRAAGGQFHASAEGLAAAKQVFEALDIPVPTSKPAAIIRSAAGIIEFQDVSLRYEENGPYALRDLSLTIQSGERIALTGPSGAGKSSLLALLLRFIEPTSGRITVDGIDLADLDPDRWRTSIGWLPQRPRLFARSVLENIRLGQPSYEQEDVKAAAGKAGAHDFVAKLPDGYDTVLGENGYGLSAGQAQRIALARTFLRTNDLVLLDEPTARLDSVSEAAVLDGINRVSRGRTALLVAHRPAVVAMADRVVRLEAGLCVPIG
jgi:ATP-binding cassette subfamily C protein CydD